MFNDDHFLLPRNYFYIYSVCVSDLNYWQDRKYKIYTMYKQTASHIISNMPKAQYWPTVIYQSNLDAYLNVSACTYTGHRQRLCAHICIQTRVSHTYIHTHLHTVVTDAAVRAARRPVEVTGGAPLHPDLDALDLHVLVEWRSEIIVLVLVLVRCGGNTHTHTQKHINNAQIQTVECEKNSHKCRHGFDLWFHLTGTTGEHLKWSSPLLLAVCRAGKHWEKWTFL